MADVDVLVVGAGAVGLACGAACVRRGLSVLVLEATDRLGSGVSSRNSGVIHAGLYYPTGSLKHRLCVDGRRRLYAYLEARGIAHQRTGKLIVATDDNEIAGLEMLLARGRANGVEGLEMISGAEARRIEPHLHAVAALVSPDTGILDVHGYMLALRGDIEDGGGALAFSTPVERIDRDGDALSVNAGGSDPASVTTRWLINSAGLHAQAIARQIECLDAAHIPALHLAKGSYFSCAGRAVFSRLIYPAPVDGGLGVHLTLDLGGRMRFGPDVEWLDARDDVDPNGLDYTVDASREDSFYVAVRRYWPGLPDKALQADYSGIRPKLAGRRSGPADFRIDGPQVHGCSGLINLFGIESPGLTAAHAIGELVADMIEAE